MIKDINESYILQNESLNNSFKSADLRDISENCKILNTKFYLDSFNYFPITENYETFHHLFKRQNDDTMDHFYTQNFFENLVKKEKNFKIFENCFVLGSSPGDNYYSNLISFLPRIFFTNEKKINLVIHRNLSNKFRNLISSICKMRNIEISFSFIDDEFYKFNNSHLPQFFNIQKSVEILKYFFEKILLNVPDLNYGDKIYVRREDVNYRKILNESDLIEKLISIGFKIMNPHHFEILDQMKIFSKASVIISPHGSNLSNIIFCNKDSKIFEIAPKFEQSYELNISERYSQLSTISKLQYSKILIDSVNVTKHSDLTKKYINQKILNESNYYKNLLLKINEIDKFIDKLQIN